MHIFITNLRSIKYSQKPVSENNFFSSLIPILRLAWNHANKSNKIQNPIVIIIISCLFAAMLRPSTIFNRLPKKIAEYRDMWKIV